MENLRGILFMVLAMGGFAIEDLFIKLLSTHVPVSEILIFLGFGGTIIFLIVARATQAPVLQRELLTRPVIIRTICELFGTLFFVSAIALTPLSSAASILQATPLVVTIGAAVFLGEKVGYRRWTAVLIGFVGVLLILHPGLDNFMLASLLAVIAVLFLAARDLATRTMRVELSTVTISIYGFFASGVAGIIAIPFYPAMVIPTSIEIIYLFAASFVGVFAYYSIVRATRDGDMSVISPFRYSRIVFAMFLSITILSERPDSLTFIGAGIIVASGIYTFIREARLQKIP